MQNVNTIDFRINGNEVEIEINQLTLINSFFYHLILSPKKKDNILAEMERVKRDAHILDGLLLLSKELDSVLKTIRFSKDEADSLQNLMKTFNVDEFQGRSFLNLELLPSFSYDYLKIHAELMAYGEFLGRLYCDPE